MALMIALPLMIFFADIVEIDAGMFISHIHLHLSYEAALAFTEGAEHALLGDFAPAEQQGTVFGLYHLLSGIMILPGAMLFGVIWQWLGMSSAFAMAALLTTIAAISLRLFATFTMDNR